MVIETWLKTDIKKGVFVTPIPGNLFSADNEGNLVGVEIYDDGVAASVTGTVTGYVIRSDGATVVLQGTLASNHASILLTSACYEIVGPISIVIKVGETTVGACAGYVYRSTTDAIVDPSHVIPSITELLNQIAACRSAATAATSASVMARNAANQADTKASAANTAASNANEKATLANNAANNANAAATRLNNLSVSAESLPAGSYADAVVSDVDFHKHITFKIPRGDTGATPNLTIGTVTTLTEGSNATAEITGTADDPVLNLGIPKGLPGTITNAFGTNIQIASDNQTSIKFYIDAATAAITDAQIDALFVEEGA